MVTLAGANFVGATTVAFGGGSVPVSPANNTSIQVTVPSGVTTGPVTVTTPVSSFTTSSNFLVLPQITGFSPNSGAVGSPVTLQGTDFTDGGAVPVVKFNGVQAVLQAGYTANTITAIVPVGATTGMITVTTANGTATNSGLFYLPPVITTFTPGGGALGSLIQITGANFVGASAVLFNGLSALTFNVIDNFTLSAQVPAGVTTGPISVTTPGGTTNSGNLLFHGTPTLLSFSPNHGLAGTNVVLTGLNLLGTTAVLFNGTPASSFTVSNNTTLSAVVSPYDTSGLISVVTPVGSTSSLSAFTIDSSDLSLAVQVSPSPVTVGGNLTYVITVTNSGPYTAPNARLGDTLPALSRLVSLATTLGTFSTNASGAVLVCSCGTLPVGGSAVVTLVDQAPATLGLVTNIASVGADDLDPVTLNNVVTNFTLVQSAPLLSIHPTPTNLIQITWPADLTNFQLQFKPDPSTNVAAWTNVTAPAAVSNLAGGPKMAVTETNTGTNRFYRLKR